MCLLTLLLSPVPSRAGSWVVSFSGSSSMPLYPANATGYNAVGNYTFVKSVVTQPWPWNQNGAHPNLIINGNQIGINCNNVGTTTLSVTASFTWTPSYPGDTSQPPPTLDVLETAVASDWTGGLPGSTGSADDGLGDSPTYPGNVGANSNGYHLVHFEISPGQTVATLPSCTVTATLPAVPSAGNTAIPGTQCNYTAQQDTREILIGCPTVDTNINGGSQYRDPALMGPVTVNVRQPDGTLRGDTLASPGSGSYTYVANVAGGWAATGTTYHWYGSISASSNSGNYSPVQSFVDSYLYGAFVGNTDHVFLSMYDGGPGNAKATANYYMHFHHQYEPAAWPLDTGYPQKVMGSDPDAASFPTPPPTYPWQLATDQNGKVVPPLIGPQGSNGAIPFTGTITKGGHVDGGLGIAKGDVSLQFGGGFDWSKSTSFGENINPTPAVGQSQQTWAIWRLSVNRSKGHLDIYGVHGYTQTGIWYKDDIVTTDYSYYQPYQPTNVTPFVPLPGWNPPGYN